MAKERSDKDILDELRLEKMIEEEERIRLEYPRLKEENAALKVQVTELTDSVSHLRGILKLRDGQFETLQTYRDSLEATVSRLETELAQVRLALRLTPKPAHDNTPRKLQPGICAACHERVLFVRTKSNDRNIPLNPRPILGEMIEWSKELVEELEALGLVVRQGYDEFGERVTVCVKPNPNPTLAKHIYSVHFDSCSKRGPAR